MAKGTTSNYYHISMHAHICIGCMYNGSNIPKHGQGMQGHQLLLEKNGKIMSYLIKWIDTQCMDMQGDLPMH